MRTRILIGLLFQYAFVFSQCIEKDKIKYGGDWAEDDLYYFPTYHFSYNGNTSKKWGVLNDLIDIRQVENYILPIKVIVEKQIREYSGDLFFTRLKFNSVAIAYPDSIEKFAERHPSCDIQSCKYKYFFYYEFLADNDATYNIGIGADKDGKIISRLNFPNKSEYQSIDTTLTVCKVINLARQIDKKIDSIEGITFEYNLKTKRFYWLISQEVSEKKPGKNKYDQVIIDAADSTRIDKKNGELFISH
jgi:hypothetical protein